MTRSIARLGMYLLLCTVAIPAVATQSEQTLQPSAAPPPTEATHAPLTILQHGSVNATQQVQSNPSADWTVRGEQGAKGQNVFRFITGDEANEFSQQMKARLADPQQRAVLRAEQRAAVVSQNASVGRLVGLDASTEQKLIELLTDQQMERIEQMHTLPRQPPDLQRYADETTRRMNALRDLLGDEKLERFQDFETSQSARYWVSQLSARLAPADRLQPDQEDRLTALKQEQFQMSSLALNPWRAFQHSVGQPLSMEDMQRDSQRRTRIANENSWRRRQVDNRVVEQKAAAFLTSVQLAELSKYQAQEQDNLRRYAEAARAEAGLGPNIPAEPEEIEEAPTLIEAQVQVDLVLKVNREPTKVTRTVRNGESFTFEAAQGLIAEATPTMYDDDYIYVQLKYYEEGVNGRRPLSGGTISTVQRRQPDGSLSTGGGGGGTVVAGRRGYAVEATVNAKVL